MVIYLLVTSEGNDQAHHLFEPTVCEPNVIKENNPDKAGRVHRQSTHRTDKIIVEDCGVQDRSGHQLDATPIDNGGLQGTLNMDNCRSTRTNMAKHTIWEMVGVDPMRHNQPWCRPEEV